jgi:O-methyltransferase
MFDAKLLPLPDAVRRPVGRFVNQVLPDRLLVAIGRYPTDGFKTMTPDTPPAIEQAFARVAKDGVTGDYYEFGMYRGYTFWTAQRAARRHRLRDARFFGFDSFRGLPKVDGRDAESTEFKEGDFSCGRDQVETYLDKYKVDWRKTRLVEGFFNDSLRPELKSQLGMRKAAVALIDCDLYSSTVDVLQFLDDLLQPGSIILFDDWNCFEASDDMGERRAFREFLAKRPQWSAEPFVSFGWHGQSFVLRAQGSGAGTNGSTR